MTNSLPSAEESSVDVRKLLRALNDSFNMDELQELCFGLQVDYENLEGATKNHKARSLIQYFSRRNRINVLVIAFQEVRPEITIEEIILEEGDEDPTESQITLPPLSEVQTKDKTDTLIVSKSITALIRLMSRPDMRTAVVAFQTDFQAASEQIDLMNDYKLVHDLFQELENRYNLINNDLKRLPADDSAWDSIAINEPELQGKIKDLLQVAKRATFAQEDARWTQQLENVSEHVHNGIEEFDLENLRQGVNLLYRVLNRYPSRVNAQLVSTASLLRLDALEEAMTTISINLLEETTISLEHHILEEVQNGVMALGGLDERLKHLVREHNAWQEIDDEIRRVKSSISISTEELEDAWFDLEPMTRDIINGQQEDWAVSLKEVTDTLDQALSEQVTVTVRRTFLRFQSQIGRRFRQVDLELLTLCQELQRIGESLDIVLRQF